MSNDAINRRQDERLIIVETAIHRVSERSRIADMSIGVAHRKHPTSECKKILRIGR
ncbi:hypothetical protein [Nostoc sp. 'Peltigera membranacea cyanobiont' N6]|uniref:hypothetical protein n=1 Tax=Nostoc sp. 'Peltigera membranacea cyanobiont' N6 TaxID=1261031 RepID=UPI0015E36823|nr:hypothetical protein [Nostoc sp. 'Peltigera membranacea cyanobiont' N6]